MGLFDKKEDVLATELTQYGKKLLRDGKFNPVYYAFYDDDLIYDVNYAGFSESHTETRDRIKDSVYMKPVYTFATKFLDDKEQLSNELGNSSILSNYSPAWNIKVLNNTFSNCSISPPSASMSITYLTKAKMAFNLDELQDTETKYRTSIYEDGSYILVRRDYLLLDVKEENEFEELGKDKFEIEFFVIEDGKEFAISFDEVSKYLDILVDNEINSKILCEKVYDKADSIFENNIESCDNYNGQLILGRDTSLTNIYEIYDDDRGKIC